MAGLDSPSSPYLVLARKYRPRDFTTLVGQDAMVQTLGNAFAQNRIHHAFILTGVRGVGKTTTARILARAFNYEDASGPHPTLDLSVEGEHCRAIIEVNPGILAKLVNIFCNFSAKRHFIASTFLY